MRTTAGLRHLFGMIYNKQPTDITTQLAMLKQRGLIVTDDDNALEQLASIIMQKDIYHLRRW